MERDEEDREERKTERKKNGGEGRRDPPEEGKQKPQISTRNETLFVDTVQGSRP